MKTEGASEKKKRATRSFSNLGLLVSPGIFSNHCNPVLAELILLMLLTCLGCSTDFATSFQLLGLRPL